ncbi:MAG: type III-A CRISPR-associated RAMP protein Csm5 [Anaerolineae bacterium]|nr:type III-A CRISPR-associated RAMP protein Csm5 [Anaerolineae bacterium]
MGNELLAAWRLNIKVLTPLHIGTGTTLTDGYDFTVHDGKTYRLNVDAILDDVWPEDPRLQDKMLGQPPAQLLKSEHFDRPAEFFSYVLAGEPVGARRQVNECVKDAQGRPYIPGSTLKGAFRTALLLGLERDPLKGAKETDARKVAQPMERRWFGNSPNTDILRALRFADSAPCPQTSLRLQPIQMVPNLVVNVEAIGPGAEMEVDVSLDTWLLAQRGKRGLDWQDKVLERVRNFLQVACCKAGKRIALEYEYHETRVNSREDAECRKFYAKIGKDLSDGRVPGFPIQIGFATGWRAKTVLGLTEDDALAPIIRNPRPDRGGHGRGSWRKGQPFPKARHVALMGGKHFLPVGWVWVRPTPLR